jgi:hypothetical protein
VAVLDPVYTPGTADVEYGSAILTLTAYDNNGNENSDDLTLTLNPLPAPATSIDGPGQVCAGNTEIFSCEEIENALDAEWTLMPEEAGTIEVVSSYEIVVHWTEAYYDFATLKVRGINDCGAGDFSDDFIVSVEDCTGVGEDPESGFSIYPNPAKDEILISFRNNNAEQSTIVIYNLLGDVVLRENGSATLNIHVTNISMLQEGLYFISVITKAGENQLQKLIISR